MAELSQFGLPQPCSPDIGKWCKSEPWALNKMWASSVLARPREQPRRIGTATAPAGGGRGDGASQSSSVGAPTAKRAARAPQSSSTPKPRTPTRTRGRAPHEAVPARSVSLGSADGHRWLAGPIAARRPCPAHPKGCSGRPAPGSAGISPACARPRAPTWPGALLPQRRQQKEAQRRGPRGRRATPTQDKSGGGQARRFSLRGSDPQELPPARGLRGFALIWPQTAEIVRVPGETNKHAHDADALRNTMCRRISL